MFRCYRSGCALFCSFLNLLRSAGTQRTGEALLLFISLFYTHYSILCGTHFDLNLSRSVVFFCCSCFVLCNATTMGHPANAVMMIDDGMRSEKMNAKNTKHSHSIACGKCRPQIRLAELQTGPFSTTIRDPNVIYTEYFMYATTFRNPLSRNKYVVRYSHH